MVNKNQQQSNANPPNPEFTAPTINLPKGGGAIRGTGEKFAANPVTGTGSMSVPIATGPGCSGFGPKPPFLMTQAPATAHSGSAGACRFPQSLEKPTRGCHDIKMLMNHTSSSSPARC